MGLFRKISLFTLCFVLLTSCYSQSSGGNSIDANIPDKLAAYSTHTIEIVIRKGSNSSFSKYQLDVPPNVTIREGISKDGNFSFEKQQAKLVWVESPKTDEFTITMIMEIGNATGQVMFEHRYYYIDGDTRKEISDGPMHVEFTPGTPRDKTIAETKNAMPVKTITPVSTPTVASTTPTVDMTSLSTPKTEEPKKVNITIPVSNTVASTNTVPAVAVTTPTNSSNTTPSSIEIKEYKVQIGSFGAKPSMAKYSNIGKVTVVEEAGVFKILAGSFPTKEEAIKKMEELKTQGHQGFVVLYINGVKAK